MKAFKAAEKIVKVEEVPAESVEVDEEPEGWIFANTTDDLMGPLVLFSGNNLISVRESGQIFYDEINEQIDNFEPTEVAQVVIGKMFLPGAFCLQSAYMRYFSSDQIGKVSATKEAVGTSERWTPEYLSNGVFAFKSAFDKFLSFDLREGLRADAVAIGEYEEFRVKCQAREVWKRQKKQAAPVDTSKEDEEGAELEALRRARAIAPGRLQSKELEEAAKGGKLHEALLDQRIKKKHDKYC